MAGKMDKKDVKLSYDSLRDINWDDIKRLAGKSIPQLCKTEVRDVLKETSKGLHENPYVKVGLIKKDLWFRIKDGDEHIDDVLLVKNWEEPFETTTVLSRQQQTGLDNWVQSRKDLLETCSDAVDEAKPLLIELLRNCEKIEVYLDKVKGGSIAEITGTGSVLVSEKTAVVLDRISSIIGEIKGIHDNDVFPDYSHHRGVKGPDEDLQLPKETYEDYTKTYFLQTVGPYYKKLESYIKVAESKFKVAQKHHALILKWSQDDAEALDNYKQEVDDLYESISEEFESIKGEEGMSPLDNLAFGLSRDTENISTYSSELLDRLFDNATGKISKARTTLKRILKRKSTFDKEFSSLKSIPKGFLANDAIKPTYDNCKVLNQTVKSHIKNCVNYLKNGEKQFKIFKKEYEKKA